MVSKEFDHPKAQKKTVQKTQKVCNMCPLTYRKVENKWNLYKEIFLMIIENLLSGSIQLFLMIDYEISANSQH